MTVAIGLVCSDGVVVASDSMASNEYQIAHQSQKVRAVEDLHVVWTASGSKYIIEEVEGAFQELGNLATSEQMVRDTFTTPILDRVRRNVSQHVHEAMKKAYKTTMPGVSSIQLRTGGTRHPWHSDFLVLGYANETPYFLELAGDGQLNWHTDGKFAAVGSGGPFAEVANGLMAHYVEGRELPVELGLWVAYRTIETTCRVSSSYVGPPVQLAVADIDGARVLTSDEVDEVEAGVEGWLQVESSSLARPDQAPQSPEDGEDAVEEEPPALDDTTATPPPVQS